MARVVVVVVVLGMVLVVGSGCSSEGYPISSGR